MDDGDEDDEGRGPDEDTDEPFLQAVKNFQHGDSPANRGDAPTASGKMGGL
jgi:hypothetical protein